MPPNGAALRTHARPAHAASDTDRSPLEVCASVDPRQGFGFKAGASNVASALIAAGLFCLSTIRKSRVLSP
jgi:hypothetical protein